MESENKNQELEAKFIALLENQLSGQEQQAIEKMIAHDPDIKAEFDITKELWEKLGNLPTPAPGAEMKTNFYALLDTFKGEAETEKKAKPAHFLESLKTFFTYKPAYNWAYALVLLVLSSTTGYFFGKRDKQTLASQEKIEMLSAEMQEMKQMMMLAMLENPVATERLKAVSYTQELKTIDNQVIDALFMTLNSDPNENVRLVTLEALIQLADNPKVREGLVQSLMKQESPLVQVELADAMVKLQEKRSVKQFKQLLKKNNLDTTVKIKIENTIKELS